MIFGSKGLRCRINNDSQSVEEFEDLVRICMRSSISRQDKTKNKQAWNNKNNRGNKKQKNSGKFGKDSEEDDDYEDEYDEDSNKDSGKKKNNKEGSKNDGRKGSSSKGESGASRIGVRMKRSPQYGYGRRYDNNQYPLEGVMQGGYGPYQNNRGNGEQEINYRRGYGNDNYDTMGINYRGGRYRREAQYSPNNGWSPGSNNRETQGNRGGYGNIEDPRGGYYNNGYGSQFGNGGGYGNAGGYGNGYGNSGGYGLNDNRWPSNGNNRNSTWRNKPSPLTNLEPCVIHCILRQKKMLDDDSTPDKGAVVKLMSRNIRDRELRQFIQDSVNECFDNIESDEVDGKCDMSKSLVMCLEERGKRGCDDWEDTGPFSNPDKWFENTSNRSPYQPSPYGQTWG